jgi:hypothetical protein
MSDAALRLQSSSMMRLRLLLLLLVIYPSDASFAILRRSSSNNNNNLLAGFVVGTNTNSKAIRIDSTVLLLHDSGDGDEDDNKDDVGEKDLPRRINDNEEEKQIVRSSYPIQDQVVDTIGRLSNTFLQCAVLVASIGIFLNLSGLAFDINDKGMVQIDTIQHMRELNQFKAEYENI